MKNTLLLVVDVQNGFVSEETEPVVSKIAALLSTKKFTNVVFTKYCNVDSSPFEKYLNWSELKTEQEQSLVPELKQFATQVFSKTAYTSITDEMKAYLEHNGIETVYIAGIDTDCCVLMSAVDIFQMGLRPIVLADYCASNGGVAFHTAALLVLTRLIGENQIERGVFQ